MAPRKRSQRIDPVTVSVLASRLSAIVEEMGEAMIRTSYSQILNSSRDFSIAMTDATGQLVAQADHIPVHVGAMPWAAKAVIARFGADDGAGRRLPAQRPLSRRQPPARPDRHPAGLRRQAHRLLAAGARASIRHRRRHAWRLQRRRDRDLAGRHPHAAAARAAPRRAAGRPLRHARSPMCAIRATSAATSRR
jgi:hypothetical protein